MALTIVPPPDTDQVPPDPTPVCVKVTLPPPMQEFGVKTTGTAFTVKSPELVTVPSGVVTFILPVVAVAGRVAVTDVELFTTNDAGTPLKVTEDVFSKFVPVMDTAIPEP